MKTPKQQPAEKVEMAKKFAAQRGLNKSSGKAFIKLCQEGCDPKFLSDKLFLLGSTKRFLVIRELGEGETQRTLKTRTALLPLDSLETALGGSKVNELLRLKNAVLDVAKRIEALNHAPIMTDINVQPKLDRHSIPETLIRYATEVIPLVIKRSKQVGTKQKPEFNQHLRELIAHVKERTGEPNYILVCDMLEGAGIETNEEALKQKIYRQRSTKRGNAK
jgi:hypothetical protein